MSDGKIIQENGENIIPITHETCVLDDEGNPITETIGDVSLLSTESRNLVGAINEVFGNIIKEQVVDALVDNGVEASANEPWSGLIEKIDNGFNNYDTKINEIKTGLVEILQNNGFNINSDTDISELLNLLEMNNISTPGVKQVACGGLASFILKNDGTLYSCGRSNALGLNVSGANIYAFTQVVDNIINDVEQVACGSSHAIILKKDGTVWACGNNNYGQLGLGTSDSYKLTFTQVTTNINNDVKEVICGYDHTFIIKKDGSLWGCGFNQYGGLGLNDSTNRNTFTQITTNVKQICCGMWHSALLKNDGSVWCTGYGAYGALGLGDTSTRYVFTQAATNVKHIACGVDQTFIVKNDGSLWGCGYNYYGDLGLNTNGEENTRTSFNQVTVNINNDVERVFSGGVKNSSKPFFQAITFIVKNDGSVWSTGRNLNGELGLSDASQRKVFTKVTTNVNNDVKQVACGDMHILMLKNDGSVWSCGANSYGQLGLGSLISSASVISSIPRGLTY